MTSKHRKETNINKASNRSFRSLFMHADRADMFLMAVGFISAIGDGLGSPAMLFFTSTAMNSIGGSSSVSADVYTDKINKNAVYLCYLSIAKWVACFLEGYCWSRTSERQASRLRLTYLKAVLRQEVAYFDLNATSTADIVASVSSDSLIIQDFISEKVPMLVMNVATFGGAYIAGFILLWRLAIVGLPFILILVIPGLIYGRILMRLSREIREEYNKADAVAQQAVSSIRTVYSFVGENKTVKDYSDALESTVKLGLKQGLAKGLAIGSNGVTFAVWAFVSWYGSRLVMYHGARGGTVWSVGAGIALGGLAFGSAMTNVKYFSDAMAASKRIQEVIKRVPAIDSENMEGEILQQVYGEVEFKNVPAGKTVALVGGSGSGKSTVIALLQRFYDPQGGEICIDGVRIDKLQLKWLRSQLGLVSQEPALFSTTIKENILFGKEDASMEEVIEAAKASNAHNFISQLPQAYDTQVGERGVQMSGGQKQRIAIARAMIKSPRILLLDEATSALDSESERVVQEALDHATIDRTTIVIAHRLSTIRNANVIYVVQNGQVVEFGSHDDLMQLDNGFYTSLVQLQETKQIDEIPSPYLPGLSSIFSTSDVNNISSPQQSMVIQSGSATSVNHNREDNFTLQANQEFPAPSFKRILALNSLEWKQALLGSVCAILFGAVQPAFSFSMGSMISVYFLIDHDEIKQKTTIYTLCFAGLSVLSMVINIIQHYNFAAMGEYLTKRVRERMLSKILTFEIGWFDQDENSSGAICSRLATDANMVRSLVGDRCSLLIQTLSAVIVACTMGLVVAWNFALVMIAVQPLMIFCHYSKKVLLKNMSQKALKSQEESSKLAVEAISNLRTITAFSSQIRIIKMLLGTQKALLRESIRQAWYAGFLLAFSQSIMAFTWALGFLYGGKLISNGHLEPKEYFQTFLILVHTGKVIADAGTMTNDLAKGFDGVQSVFTVLDRNTLIDPEVHDGKKPEVITGHVEICDVHFAYPARPDIKIFNGFSISIEAGKSTALVGQSGSGKSTIIGLIQRFYDPMEGVVKVDGRDIKLYHLRTLRKFIGLVSQEPTLFASTIRENIILLVSSSSETQDQSERMVL
ncbi:putative ABC-type xenobiotic transporter [Helianthus annuus]|nr:putative ABC-type xenobiotic transporter [Helianthus annuus]